MPGPAHQQADPRLGAGLFVPAGQPGLMPAHTRRYRSRRALIGALALLAAILGATLTGLGRADAQIPLPPHWFWGAEFGEFEGDTIRAVTVSGTELGTATISNGQWLLYLQSDHDSMIRFQLVSASALRTSRSFELRHGELTLVRPSDFGPPQATVTNTLSLRIIARMLDDGRIEFGVRDPAGVETLPDQRVFPTTAITNRWLHSSVIDFGDGFSGRIIARRLADGRTEFGFRVPGYEDVLPERRYFPISPGHDRWLVSSLIAISPAR